MSQAESNRRWRENNPEKWAEINRNNQRRHIEKMTGLGYVRKTVWLNPKEPKVIAERPECEICSQAVKKTSREWVGHCSYPVAVYYCKLSRCAING